MGIATSAQLSFEDRISFLKKTPFFIYLQDATLLELAECVQFTLTAHKGNRVTLEEETIYIVIEGELELSVLLPTADKKNESLGYLCKKKPGDILSKISVNKQATRKVNFFHVDIIRSPHRCKGQIVQLFPVDVSSNEKA